jgi:hypothetical protein
MGPFELSGCCRDEKMSRMEAASDIQLAAGDDVMALGDAIYMRISAGIINYNCGARTTSHQ